MCGGMIVESEAYLGESDPASHAYRGQTKRNSLMYESGGVVYVYLIYGIHYCFNITTDREGVPGAVLVRALQPEFGIEKMKERRGVIALERIATGPGNLTQALAIDQNDNGKKISEENIFIATSSFQNPEIKRSERIGISRAKKLKYRFFARANSFVSKGNLKAG